MTQEWMRPAADTCAAEDGLLLTDLHPDPQTLAQALGQCLSDRSWLDAYLVSASLFQLVEDRLHADRWQLRRGAAFLRATGDGMASRLGRVADASASVSERLTRPRAVRQWLDEARGSLAGLTSVLGAVVQDPHSPPPDADGLNLLAERARAFAACSGDDVVRLPACFRSFDLHPDDVWWLARAFRERHPRAGRICVVGVRTSGCYLAPLLAAALRTGGTGPVDVLTHRPAHPFHRWEKDVLRAAAQTGARVVVTDDPPGTGASLAATVAAVVAAGVPRHKVTLVLPSFSDDPELPGPLAGCDAVLQPWSEHSVHDRLEASKVGQTLEGLLPPGVRVDRCLRLDAPDAGGTRRHARARYLVETTTLETSEQTRLAVMVEGAGLGYLGRHAVAVSATLRERTPTVYGFVDGMLYREWLPPAPEPLDDATGVEVVTRYVTERRRALSVDADPTPRMRSRDPVWEVAAALVARVYGPLAPVARPFLLEPLTRRLLRTQRPSVVDGATELHRWLPDPVRPGQWTKVDFHLRAFGHLEASCYDAVFDLAGAVGDPPSQVFGQKLRAAFQRETGELVDAERWLFYRLAHLWRQAKAGDIDERTRARRSADAVHEYLRDCFLSDVSLARGPLCAIDLDGVLETDRLGYPASGPAGALALRALIAHGYRPVVATGRSATDAIDRCTAFGLAGAVAEYGSVVYDNGRRTTTDLRTPAERHLIEQTRCLLTRRGLDVSPTHRYTVRVRVEGGPLPAEVVDALPLLQDPRLRIVHGEGQSDVTVRRLDKAVGLQTLAGLLGGAPCALAVGDSTADLSMLLSAEVARSPRNAEPRLRQLGVPMTRGAYQAGLVDACADLLGHRPGRCRVCEAPRLTRRAREVLTVLSLPEAGMRGLLRRSVVLMFLVATGGSAGHTSVTTTRGRPRVRTSRVARHTEVRARSRLPASGTASSSRERRRKGTD